MVGRERSSSATASTLASTVLSACTSCSRARCCDESVRKRRVHAANMPKERQSESAWQSKRQGALWAARPGGAKSKQGLRALLLAAFRGLHGTPSLWIGRKTVGCCRQRAARDALSTRGRTVATWKPNGTASTPDARFIPKNPEIIAETPTQRPAMLSVSSSRAMRLRSLSSCEKGCIAEAMQSSQARGECVQGHENVGATMGREHLQLERHLRWWK